MPDLVAVERPSQRRHKDEVAIVPAQAGREPFPDLSTTVLAECRGELLQDAKDTLEATKFVTGTGTNEPFGFITGFTTTVNATAGGVFDLEDLYRLVEQLPPRYQGRASFAGSLPIYNKIRQFDTAGGAALWSDNLTLGRPGVLLGKPAYEVSTMATTTGVGALFLAYADFSRFVVVDRIGLTVEVVQHLVGTNHRPTGQRGLFAYFRNGQQGR